MSKPPVDNTAQQNVFLSLLEEAKNPGLADPTGFFARLGTRIQTKYTP